MDERKPTLGENINRLIAECPYIGIIDKASFSGFTSIKGTVLDPSNPNTVWENISKTQVRLKSNQVLNHKFVRKIVKDDFKKIWPILKVANRIIPVFYRAIQNKFKEDAISLRSLYNVINDSKKKILDTTLYQVGLILKKEIIELKEGTASEPPDVGPSTSSAPYNRTSTLRHLYHGLPFKPKMIDIEAGGHTEEEKEEITGHECSKFIVLTRGKVDLIFKRKDSTERIELKLNEGYNFASGEYHYFENKGKQFAHIVEICYAKPI
jgi:hypothetical protein